MRSSKELASRLRAAGGPIVWVRVSFASNFADAPPARVDQPSDMGSLPAGWDEFLEALPPSDLMVTKRQWGAFYGTDLDLQLRRRGVNTIVLGGIASSIGVESTARSAWEHGYGLVLCEDLCSDLSEETHAHSFKYNLSPLVTCGEFGVDYLRMSTPKVSTRLPAKSRLGSWPVPLLWLALLALSVSIFAGWSVLRLPAALLLGPMIGAIVLGVNGAKIQVPSIPFLGAQALIAAIGGEKHHPLDPGDIQSSVWALLHGDIRYPARRCRHRLVDQSNGIDQRCNRRVWHLAGRGQCNGHSRRGGRRRCALVAFMQFSRVVLVAGAAALVARFWAHLGNAHAPTATLVRARSLGQTLPWYSSLHC